MTIAEKITQAQTLTKTWALGKMIKFRDTNRYIKVRFPSYFDEWIFARGKKVEKPCSICGKILIRFSKREYVVCFDCRTKQQNEKNKYYWEIAKRSRLERTKTMSDTETLNPLNSDEPTPESTQPEGESTQPGAVADEAGEVL